MLWKLANALVAANECLKSLGLKSLVQTPNVFVVASRTGSLSPQLTAATSLSAPKFGIYILLCTS